MSLARTCASHPESLALATCSACGAVMCDVCWAFMLNEAPACAACVYERERAGHRAASWGFVLFSATVGLAAYFSVACFPEIAKTIVIGATVIALVILGKTFQSVSAHRQLVPARRRTEHDPAPALPAEAAQPYRGGPLRRLKRAMVPALSGRNTAAVMGLLLLGTALAFPAALHLPRWLENEAVIASWWCIAVVALSTMLYRGTKMREDHAFVIKWELPKLGGGSVDWLPIDVPSADGEGCLILIGVVIAFVVAFGLALVMVELVIPLVFFLLYWGIVKGIGRVINDKHDCTGNVARSLTWGAWWATLYTAPPALLTFAYHAWLLRR